MAIFSDSPDEIDRSGILPNKRIMITYSFGSQFNIDNRLQQLHHSQLLFVANHMPNWNKVMQPDVDEYITAVKSIWLKGELSF